MTPLFIYLHKRKYGWSQPSVFGVLSHASVFPDVRLVNGGLRR